MRSALRTKVFEGHIMPQVQRWIADNPLRRHDQTLDFHRWWQIITGSPLADGNTFSRWGRGSLWTSWSLTADQGTSWHSRTIDVPQGSKAVRFVAEVGYVYSDIGIDDVPLSSSSRTGATCRSKCKASRSTRAKEEEEQKLDESTEKAVQELLAERGVEELKAQPAVSSSSFWLVARPKTNPALVPKPPAVAPPEHLLKQGTTFAKAFGELSSADIENWDLHT